MANPQDELEALRAQLAALTIRIYRLEQQAGLGPPQAAPVAAAPAAPVSQPASSAPPPGKKTPPLPPPPSFLTASKGPAGKEEVTLEKRIGQYWLNRIGIVAVLFGVSYFLKYAFDNGWIGDAGRVAIGLVAGIAMVLWSERFRRKNYAAFSYSLKAVGIGTLYLSLWYAYQKANLISVEVAFIAMALVTASTIALALSQDAELLAAFALAGGYGTPLMLSTGQNHEVFLFSYVALLDVAVLVMARFRPWRRLLWGSFAGTVLLFCGWSSEFYTLEQRTVTMLFATLFAVIFASIPLVTPFARSTRLPGPAITLTLVPFLNAAWYFLSLYVMYRHEALTLTIFALGLAAAYLIISNVYQRQFAGDEARVITLLHIAIAIAFITLAIPIKLTRHWITMGWLIESAVLLWIAVKTKATFLRYLAGTTLALGILRLLLWDDFYPQTLVFNARFATYLVAVAVMGGIVYFGKRYGSPGEQKYVRMAAVALNVLALIALTGEPFYYFDRRQSAIYDGGGYSPAYQQLQLARDFSYSAIWLVYGSILMAIGFIKKTAFVRWQALVLIAVTILKVFAYDTRLLEKGFRILSFIGLGVVLLVISFIYQRDWLKLSSRGSEETSS